MFDKSLTMHKAVSVSGFNFWKGRSGFSLCWRTQQRQEYYPNCGAQTPLSLKSCKTWLLQAFVWKPADDQDLRNRHFAHFFLLWLMTRKTLEVVWLSGWDRMTNYTGRSALPRVVLCNYAGLASLKCFSRMVAFFMAIKTNIRIFYFTKRKGLKYATSAWLKECAPRSNYAADFVVGICHSHRPELLLMIPSVIVGGSMDKGCPCLKRVYCMKYW